MGISVKTPFLKIAEGITRRIKDEIGALVVWGGSHPTIMPEESINNADIVCVGEGEYPFLELVEKKARGEAIDHVQNLCVRGNGGAVRNNIRPLLQTRVLNALPFPDCGGEGKYAINNGRLIHGDPLNTTIAYYAMATRGCPFRCSFCINSVLRELYHGCGPFVRFRSPENVVDEIVDILERFPSVRGIRFQDEVFPSKRNWIERFCEAYKRRVGLPFYCTFHPNTVDEEAVRMLKGAGLIVVGFGMQSPSERVRKELYHRPETNDTILKSIEILHRNKLEGFYDIILDNPFETEDDKKEGLNFLLKIPKPFNIAAFALKFFPGYKITDEGLSQGVIDDSEVTAIASQGYFEMTYNFYSPRKKEDHFWNCLYILSSRSTLPGFLVKSMSRWKFLKSHPQSLVLFVKLSWYPELLVIGIRRLIRGQTRALNFIRVMKSRILKQTV